MRSISPKKRPGLQISRAWRSHMEIIGIVAARPPTGNGFFYGLAGRKSNGFAATPVSDPCHGIWLMIGSAGSYRHGPSKKMRIKSKTIGNFDYAVDAAKVLENVFGKVCGFGLCPPNTESLSLPFTNVPVTVVEVRRRAGSSYPGRTTKDQRQTIPNRSLRHGLQAA
jgi:hypothetical protein